MFASLICIRNNLFTFFPREYRNKYRLTIAVNKDWKKVSKNERKEKK